MTSREEYEAAGVVTRKFAARYVATINVPGYLPMDDDPPVFDTAADAWGYLVAERERAEEDVAYDDDEVSDCLADLRRIAESASYGLRFGTAYGGTPGYEGEHDLGLAYSVMVAEDD
jgi:hypothetical protein